MGLIDLLTLHVAVELNYGTLYCFKCRDYIYDAALDEISRSIDQQLAHKNYHISRQPVAYVAWEPTNDEIDLLKKNPKRKRVEPGSTIGETCCLLPSPDLHTGYIILCNLLFLVYKDSVTV